MDQMEQLQAAHRELAARTQHEELVAKINAMSDQLELLTAAVAKLTSKKAAKSEE